jgi:predicted ferric reductase
MRLSKTPYLLVVIILVLIIIHGIIFLLTRDLEIIYRVLYNPYSFFLLVVVILEYIILKGMDRSRIYKLEVERLKKKRRKDMEFHVRVEKQIRELEKYTDDPNARDELKSRLKKIQNEFNEF